MPDPYAMALLEFKAWQLFVFPIYEQIVAAKRYIPWLRHSIKRNFRRIVFVDAIDY